MFLHPGRSSIRVECITCHARINEECGLLPGEGGPLEWRRQPSVDELRTFVETVAWSAVPLDELVRRARAIMEG